MQPSIPGNTMTDNIYGAKLQRDGKTYAIQTRIPAGVVSPDDLETIARVAKSTQYLLSRSPPASDSCWLVFRRKTSVTCERIWDHSVRHPSLPVYVTSSHARAFGPARTALRIPSTLQRKFPKNTLEKSSRQRLRSGSPAARDAAGRAGSGISVLWEQQKAGPSLLADTAGSNPGWESRSPPVLLRNKPGIASGIFLHIIKHMQSQRSGLHGSLNGQELIG